MLGVHGSKAWQPGTFGHRSRQIMESGCDKDTLPSDVPVGGCYQYVLQSAVDNKIHSTVQCVDNKIVSGLIDTTCQGCQSTTFMDSLIQYYDFYHHSPKSDIEIGSNFLKIPLIHLHLHEF